MNPQGLQRYGHTFATFEKRRALMLSLYGIELQTFVPAPVPADRSGFVPRDAKIEVLSWPKL